MSCHGLKICFLVFLISTNCEGQTPSLNLLDSISGQVITQIRSSEKKNIFLTHDRSIYAAGESIWFQAFVTNKFSGKLSHDGQPFFIDLVDHNDSLITKLLLNSSGIHTNGKIDTPDSLATGYYWLRAYTTRVTGLDIGNNHDAFFAEPIYIINPKKPATPQKSNPPINKVNKPIIEFSPEGGLFVTGTNSVVAYKITDPEGNPLALNGYILDSRDSLITNFSSGKNGLGKISLFPYRFRKYKAILNWQGKNVEYLLPAFNLYAAQLSVVRSSDHSRTLRVILEDSLHKKDFTTYLVGVSNDSLCFASIGNGRYDVFVPDQKFPAGIATFFLFDKNFNCLSERSVFIRRDDLTLNARLHKSVFTKREQANLDISLRDKLNKTAPALVSVSVADSSLSAFFQQPSVESKDFSNLTEEETDLLMLNRPPIHRQLFNSRSIPELHSGSSHLPTAAGSKGQRSEDTLLYIKGRVVNEKNEPVSQSVVMLFSGSAGLMPVTDTTDANGRFTFPLTFYTDSTQFAMQVSNLQGKIEKHQILLDPQIFPHPKTPSTLKNKLEQSLTAHESEFSSYIDTNVYKGREWLASVIVQQNLKKKNNYEVKRVTGFSTIIPGERFTKGGANNLTRAVLSISGVQMLNGYVVIHGPGSMGAPDKSSEPIVIVDGIQMALPDAEFSSPLIQFLNTFDASQIEFVEILKGSEGTKYGTRGANGVISINTRKNVIDYSKNPTLKIFYPRGYAIPAYFPVIDYEDKKTRSSKETDHRGTLLWNPATLLNEKGDASLSFFTSDIAGTYVVTLTGITAYGNLVTRKITFYNR